LALWDFIRELSVKKTPLVLAIMVAIVANAQDDRRSDDDRPWSTPCSSDADCPGTRCRVLGLMADDHPVLFADDIRDDVLERQAMITEARSAPLTIDPPHCAQGDECGPRRPVTIEVTMPVMACETVVIQEQRMADEEARE
jgi:hypothetical protein